MRHGPGDGGPAHAPSNARLALAVEAQTSRAGCRVFREDTLALVSMTALAGSRGRHGGGGGSGGEDERAEEDGDENEDEDGGAESGADDAARAAGRMATSAVGGGAAVMLEIGVPSLGSRVSGR